MRFYLTIFLFLISNFMFSQNLDELRLLLRNGENSQKSAKTLIEKSKQAVDKTNKPIYASFQAVGNFFMAKHVFSPLKKMSYFNEGKKIMDNAVNNDPKNPEIRLMRLITQEKAPKILGYSKNIADDKKVILEEYQNIQDSELKLYIKNYLKL